MLHRRASPEEYGRRIVALLGGSRLSTVVLRELSRRLHMNQKATEHSEVKEAWELILDAAIADGERMGREQGLQKGLEQGLKSGLEQGRQTLLALADHFAPESLAELEGIEDLEALQEAVKAVLARGWKG
jgi:flagellar biosynthesis/type III secretory pathway protein FliH